MTTTKIDTYNPGRPIMTRAELVQHHIEDRSRDYRFSDDGYSDMEHESKAGGWKALAGWARDGYDLGDWPYVSFLIRKHDDRYGLLQIVEGDRSQWEFETQQDLYAAIDYMFLWYSAGEDWAPLTYEQRETLNTGGLQVDDRFRGPYRTS